MKNWMKNIRISKDAVPGFRKGRAPIRLLEKRFGTDITKQVKLELMGGQRSGPQRQ
jgi:FKBP-type peptidyl-prolyl cis-trans isomerase (trigger factor)